MEELNSNAFFNERFPIGKKIVVYCGKSTGDWGEDGSQSTTTTATTEQQSQQQQQQDQQSSQHQKQEHTAFLKRYVERYPQRERETSHEAAC